MQNRYFKKVKVDQGGSMVLQRQPRGAPQTTALIFVGLESIGSLDNSSKYIMERDHNCILRIRICMDSDIGLPLVWCII